MTKKIKDANGTVYVKKRSFYRRIWFWIIIVFLVLGGLGSLGSRNDDNSQTKSSRAAKSVNRVTQKNFQKISVSDTDGPTKQDVKKLFGKKADTTSSTNVDGTSGDEMIWNDVAGATIGSSIAISFVNNHAVSKSITGLKVQRPHKLTLGDFEMLENGMTKAQVKQLFGKPNGDTINNFGGQKAEIWEYTSDIAGKTGANFNVTFTSGIVSGKAQTSMNGKASKRIIKLAKSFNATSSTVDNDDQKSQSTASFESSQSVSANMISSANNNASAPAQDDQTAAANSLTDYVNQHGMSPTAQKVDQGMSVQNALASTPDDMKTSGEIQYQIGIQQGYIQPSD